MTNMDECGSLRSLEGAERTASFGEGTCRDGGLTPIAKVRVAELNPVVRGQVRCGIGYLHGGVDEVGQNRFLGFCARRPFQPGRREALECAPPTGP